MNQKVDIILIEDNAHDIELTLRAMKKNSILNGLLHFQNGEEALDYIFATGKHAGRNMNDVPKVILLDLKMPTISGLEVLKRIKSDDRTKIIPVVLLTASNQDKDITEGYKLGANSYIVKPVGFENFVKAVSDLGLYWLLVNQPPK